MAKIKNTFFCQECGYESPKWLGRCPGCGSWNSLREELIKKDSGRNHYQATPAKPQLITSVTVEPEPRMKIGMGEVDRVLGGGIVPGSLLLLGGDPGIGKSTLALQIAMNIAHQKEDVLYVSGEESAAQIRMRADRLGELPESLSLLTATELDSIITESKGLSPKLIIIDSIQTLYLSEIASAPGSVSQVRECTGRLLRLAKESSSSILIIGHVTKDGAIAGPRMLEHMVDCVLYFEGDHRQIFRILRGIKNRFGGTHEAGIFSMTQAGLQEVENPSSLLLEERPTEASGSVIFSALEGVRPLLLEIQALVSPSSFGTPRRTTNGFEMGRLALLSAVVEKKLGFPLSSQDIYINIVGGLTVQEPASDLAVIASLISSFQNRKIPSKAVIFGEVGLTGEVRSISQIQLRINEAKRQGYSIFVIPEGNRKDITKSKEYEIFGVKNIGDFAKWIQNSGKE